MNQSLETAFGFRTDSRGYTAKIDNVASNLQQAPFPERHPADDRVALPRLLMIDHDPAIRNLVSEVALAAGYAPEATEAFDAFESLYQTDTSIAVINITMPDVDGIEILRFLAAQNSQTWIVLVGDVDGRIMAAAERLAAARNLWLLGSLRKPFDAVQLRRLLTQSRPDIPSNGSQRVQLVTPEDLAIGIEDNQLVPFFQPKIDVQSLEFVAVEALVRWEHPDQGLLTPYMFVPVAESCGLIGELTRSVIEKSVAQCAEWSKQGLKLKTSINISARLLTDLNLPERLYERVASYGIEPSQIVFEITESWMTDNPIMTLDILTRLRLKGFELSIDDFGTGYSTMLQLKEIPFSELKLDQSFIRGAASDKDARIIVDSSIALGHKLGLHVVAEGVETQRDWDLITELGCDEGQGYFIARPMRGGNVTDWLSRWNLQFG